MGFYKKLFMKKHQESEIREGIRRIGVKWYDSLRSDDRTVSYEKYLDSIMDLISGVEKEAKKETLDNLPLMSIASAYEKEGMLGIINLIDSLSIPSQPLQGKQEEEK